MARPGRRRILVLEDDPAVQRFIAAALDGLELLLLPCSTLAQARGTLRNRPVQLMVIDLTVPDGSGLELLQWLNAQRWPCRTIVFSGTADAALLQHQLQAYGVWRVLLKPASAADLRSCVCDALNEARERVDSASTA